MPVHTWDEAEHPRSVLGRFAAKLEASKPSSGVERHTLQDGSATVAISRGHRGKGKKIVVHAKEPNGSVTTTAHTSEAAAAKAALDHSAKMTKPDSLGGARKLDGVDEATKLHEAKLNATTKRAQRPNVPTSSRGGGPAKKPYKSKAAPADKPDATGMKITPYTSSTDRVEFNGQMYLVRKDNGEVRHTGSGKILQESGSRADALKAIRKHGARPKR